MKKKENETDKKNNQYMEYFYSMDGSDSDIMPDDDTMEDHDIMSEDESLEEEIQTEKTEQEEVVDSVRLYMNEIGRVPLLTKEEEVELAKRIKNGDQAAKNKMAQANLRYVIFIAKNFTGRGLSFPDLIQEGNIGLMKAIEKYDYKKGAFSTYAKYWIEKYILHALNKDNVHKGALSLNMEIGEENDEELEAVLRIPDEHLVDDMVMEEQTSLDMTGVLENMKKIPCDDPKEKLVLHILTSEFHEKSINSILKKAGMTREEYDKIKKKLYNKVKKVIRQGGYVEEETGAEDIGEYLNHLKYVSSGETTKLIQKQNRLTDYIFGMEKQHIRLPKKCWDMDAGSFYGSEKEERFLKQVEQIKSVDCSKYVMRYLKAHYGTKEEELCLKYLKADYKRSGVTVSKMKAYFAGLVSDLNETKLNDMALATGMTMEIYSAFRKKVIKCAESDFTQREYIYMYFTLKYAAFCGFSNYKEAYDCLDALYKDVREENVSDSVLENMYDASRRIGNEILFYIEDIDQLKSEYKDILFTEKIEKLEDIIRKTEVIKKKKLMGSSEELFHNQLKELRENITQYDGNEITYEYYLRKAQERGESIFDVPKQVDIDRPYIRRTLYGVMDPDVEDACVIGKKSSFLNTDEFLNALIYDDNVISSFSTRPAMTKRNLLLTLLFANFCYKLLNSTRVSDNYEERLAYFEDKVYRELSACGYMALNNENAYDLYLKLVLTCAEPLELYRYMWMKKLDQPMWDYCIDDPDRYMDRKRRK